MKKQDDKDELREKLRRLSYVNRIKFTLVVKYFMFLQRYYDFQIWWVLWQLQLNAKP
jgi:hypothetical protein